MPPPGEFDLEHDPASGGSLPILVIGALGVVYGDIGTSPIYAFRQVLRVAASDGGVLREDVLGVLSLILWSLTLVVTVKYVSFVLKADNKGEGGTLSLMELARSSFASRPLLVLGIGVVGASLFMGDAVITPAISVLSAVEGLNTVTPAFQPYVVPITILILLGLFSVQRFGTRAVATVFGPVMGIWFLALGFSGLLHIFDDPHILLAINPHHALMFLLANPGLAFATIGAAFLAVTGAEALYVDLGHFGRRPIVITWLAIVFPCLLLNYFGQGAYVLSQDTLPGNVFFDMQASWMLVPMVVLATAATVIASQAVISGAFSLVRQAVQMNILPRFGILHTSETQLGQIYIPRVNWIIATGVILLVLGFEESGNLASAYGISVTGEMVVTSILLFVVMLRIWHWNLLVAIAVITLFLAIDLVFLGANIIKVEDGGWVSLVIAFVMSVIMWTWIRGSRNLFEKTRKTEVSLGLIVEQMQSKPPTVVPGTAVFLTGDLESAPTALMHSLKHYKVLHEKNVILTVLTASTPYVANDERVEMEGISDLFMRVKITFGYMEQPNLPRALALCRKKGWKFDIMTTSFFLSRRSLKAAKRSTMPLWQDKLFVALARNASDATAYFQIPSGRVVEIGAQVVI